MFVTRFCASRFRNIGECDISFCPGVNLLIGENAQGKTNVLEGIYFYARGKSFRGASDAEMTAFGEEGYETSLSFTTKDRPEVLSYRYENGSRRRERNGVYLPRLAESLGIFRAVLFYPDHLQIIKGAPEKRREFLNVAVSGQDPAYLKYYMKYAKILDNRNAILKTASRGGYFDMTELEAWSEQLASAAAEIYVRRKQYLRGFAPLAAEILNDLSGKKEQLTYSYESDVTADSVGEAEKQYRHLLTENLKRECLVGCTQYGVHRDDLDVRIDGKSARDYASQGQQRSVILAMKLAEGEYSRVLSGDPPVFLFDDVLSELDEERRAYVLRYTREQQLILTACDKHYPSGSFEEIRVSGGTYVSSCR